MEYFYTVIEIQQNSEDARSCIPVIFENYNDALARFYQLCSAAAISTIPYHSVHMLRSDGRISEQHIFDRRNQE